MSLIPLGILAAAGAGVAGSYDLLETEILDSSASSVTFTGLGAYTDYKHLQLRMTTRSTRTSSERDFTDIIINGDTSANYAQHDLFSNPPSVGSTDRLNLSALTFGGGTTSTNINNNYGGSVIDFLDPFSTTKNLTMRAFSGQAGSNAVLMLSSAAYFNTSSVDSMQIQPVSSSFVAGSRFSLYGIKAA